MAINNIEEYLIERLLDLDPTLSSRQGSLMFVKVIEPLINRLGTDPIGVDVESFVVQRLRDEFPELDVASPGSSLRDLLVSPLILLLEPIRREVEFLRTQQSLASASALSQTELDALLANIFTERVLGDYARGVVRVFFSAPYALSLDSSILFTTSEGLTFVPEAVTVVPSSDFTRSGGQYYVDIDVRSQAPDSTHNIPAGSVNAAVGLLNVVRVTNLYGFSGGVSTETNEEFLERAERSLSERSLNTKRGIETALLNSFSDLVSIDVIGFGEDEMQRDILQGEVDFDTTEATGPMSYMTSDWRTHDVLNINDRKRFPFTNVVVLKEPAAGWSEKAEQRILNAKYLRIAEGASESYDHRLLGRVRSIAESVKDAGGDIYIRTSDFEVFPPPASITEQTEPLTVTTDGLRQGLNMESSQGSTFKLYCEVDDTERIAGAHLPFTDVIETDFNSSQVPGSVIKGRDFLIVAGKPTFGTNAGGDLGIRHALLSRAYPLTRFFSSSKLGVGRTDSFLLSRNRYLYRGLDSFVFDPSLTYCAINEHPTIVDFGAPKYSANPDIDVVYSGVDYEDSGKNPGVALEGKKIGESGPGSVPETNIYGIFGTPAIEHEADLILSGSVPPWDMRGAQVGQHIACTLYAGDDVSLFDGTLTNARSSICWQGLGVVSKVGEGDRWRLRVKGLDWHKLEERGLASFAPSASATVTVDDVGLPDSGSFDKVTYLGASCMPHPKGFNLTWNLQFDTDKDGTVEPDNSVGASALDRWFNPATSVWEPASEDGTRSILTIKADAATYVPPINNFYLKVTDSAGNSFRTPNIAPGHCATHEDFADAVGKAVLGGRIDGKDPASNAAYGGLIEENEGAGLGAEDLSDYTVGRLVLRSILYGNIPSDMDWQTTLHNSADDAELEIVGTNIGEWSLVPDRSPEALAYTLVEELNHHSSVTLPFEARLMKTNTAIRIETQENGNSGNGYGVLPQNTDTEWGSVTQWNGLDANNINGGFSAGFGPKLQVKGIVPLDQLAGPPGVLPVETITDITDAGYEKPELSSPAWDSDELVLNTEHQNLVSKRHATDDATNVRVIIDFMDGADSLRFTLDDDGEGNLVENQHASKVNATYWYGTFSGEVDYLRGKILLKVNDIAAHPIPDAVQIYFAYSFYELPFKLAWTLYRGSIEVLDSAGTATRSYDELTYAPAMLNPDNLIQHSSNSLYDGERFRNSGDWLTSTAMRPYNVLDHEVDGYWIRLGKPFHANHPSIGSSPHGYIASAEITDVDTPSRTGHDWSLDYARTRLQPNGDGTISTKVSLPYSPGHFAMDEIDSSGEIWPVSPVVIAPKNNSVGQSGFLIPVPMGTSNYSTHDYIAPNAITDADLLEHQVVQLFEGAPTDYGKTRINVSGIPGGVPLPGYTAVDLTVDSGAIHIGGMTDVYAKPSGSTARTTPVMKLGASAPMVVDGVLGDVVLQAADGQIKPVVDPSHFFSAELESELTNLFGASPAFVDNLVLEIIEPPSAEISPVFVRILHSIPGGCKVAGSWPDGLDDGFENLKFRVMRSTSTCLNNPLEILQQGEDLTTTENSMTVEFAGGLNFDTNPENVGMFLSIDSLSGGGDTYTGEYSVVSRNISSLTLDRVVSKSGTGLSYRLYTKQSSGVDLPLVRVTDVSLSGDSSGIKIPYANPIDVVGSSFAGLNDDPINEDIGAWDGGELKVEEVTLHGELVSRCTFYREGADFKALGIIRYDVVVLQELGENLMYWYIDDVQVGTDGNNSLLVLDRAEVIKGDVIETPFTIGKPSVGTASIKFLDKTFFEIGPETVFSYQDPSTDKKHFLRPSPAESALIYRSPVNRSTVRLYGSNNKLLVTTDDFFRHGVAVGDELRIVSKTIKSEEFQGELLEHESLSIAGQTIAFKIENSIKTATFSGPNPVSLDSAVNDINQQLGGSLRAEVYTETRDDGFGDKDYYRVMIHSSNDVELVHQGSIGIVETLRFTSDMDNTPDVADFIDVFEVRGVDYTAASDHADGVARTNITVDRAISGTPAEATDFETVFIEIIRSKYQRVYPADMVDDGSGIYSAEVKLTSFEPNTSQGIVPEDGQLTVEGYSSLGYSLSVENNNYSYSVGENVDIVTSSVVMNSSADSFEDVYELPGAEVTVSYDTAPTLASVQSYMLNPNVRVVCNNPLVRHYFPAYPLMSVIYSGSLNASHVEEKIASFLSTLYPNLPLEVYSMVSMLSRLGVTYLQSPQEVGFIVHDKDRNITVVRDKNRVSLSKQSHVMEDMSLVNVNKVG